MLPEPRRGAREILKLSHQRPDLDFIGADGLARTITFASSSLLFVLYTECCLVYSCATTGREALANDPENPCYLNILHPGGQPPLITSTAEEPIMIVSGFPIVNEALKTSSASRDKSKRFRERSAHIDGPRNRANTTGHSTLHCKPQTCVAHYRLPEFFIC